MFAGDEVGASVEAGSTSGAAACTVGSALPMGATILFIKIINPANQTTPNTSFPALCI
jgi:hypothetical protein